ncbi:DUF547 domain-containing protein [Algihabitans sp.]|uniref:DUF547 domain-containing protein n=1 Tax=Algihabitans sp. TaxID=2821514 RepID=UPI003BAC3E56
MTMTSGDRTRTTLTRRGLLGLAAAATATGLAGIGGAAPAAAAPASDLWPRWLPHDPESRLTVDHDAWDAILASYARPDGAGIIRVAYAAVTPQDRDALRRYLDLLASQPVAQLNREEQFAYWVNLYNALTVETILAHYPVDSIRDIDISPGFFSSGPWGAKLIEVEATAVSLDDVEHRILRPIWNQDPLIHYAVNCAAIGCPNLQTRAFRAATTRQTLDAAARAFVNHPRAASFPNGGLVVSSIYRWFREDFGDSQAGVIAHLRDYAAPALSARLAGVTDIFDHRYDWSLNGASPSTG